MTIHSINNGYSSTSFKSRVNPAMAKKIAKATGFELGLSAIGSNSTRLTDFTTTYVERFGTTTPIFTFSFQTGGLGDKLAATYAYTGKKVRSAKALFSAIKHNVEELERDNISLTLAEAKEKAFFSGKMGKINNAVRRLRQQYPNHSELIESKKNISTKDIVRIAEAYSKKLI